MNNEFWENGHLITDAVLLKSVPNSDYNRLLYFLSPLVGIETCFAFGAQKIKSRFCSATQPFTMLRLFLRRDKKTGLIGVTDVANIVAPKAVRIDLRAVYQLSFYSQILLHTPMEPSDYKKYYYLMKYSIELIDMENGLEKSLMFFLSKLAVLHGQAMQASYCRECGNVKRYNEMFYSAGAWGFFCQDHLCGADSGVFKIDAEDAAVMDFYSAAKFTAISAAPLKLRSPVYAIRILIDIVNKIYSGSIKREWYENLV
ncbi:MAG: DNA repair protein RecO [Spirochaetales bacterium]|nr:DNA repair protein RecO [Spirochaetales bacterium]